MFDFKEMLLDKAKEQGLTGDSIYQKVSDLLFAKIVEYTRECNKINDGVLFSYILAEVSKDENCDCPATASYSLVSVARNAKGEAGEFSHKSFDLKELILSIIPKSDMAILKMAGGAFGFDIDEKIQGFQDGLAEGMQKEVEMDEKHGATCIVGMAKGGEQKTVNFMTAIHSPGPHLLGMIRPVDIRKRFQKLL